MKFNIKDGFEFTRDKFSADPRFQGPWGHYT